MTTEQQRYHIKIVGPLGDSISNYDRTQTPITKSSLNGKHEAPPVDQTFIDAMIVREEVFVREQKVPLENELDDDDASCIHLVLYTPSKQQEATTSSLPAGTIRIVPLHNALHTQFDKHRHYNGTPYMGKVQSSSYDEQEYFIKLGRLAIIERERSHGYAGALVRAALDYAAENIQQLSPTSAPHDSDQQQESLPWKGLVLIHAQKQVQKFWTKCGFTVDEGIGLWDEEGIGHVAMWTRVAFHQ